MQVRHATPADVPALLPLVEEYWRFEAIAGFDPGLVAAELERLLSRPPLGACWIAEAHGTAAGYLLAVYVFSLESLGLTAEIDELYVTSAHRGHGVGAALLERAEVGAAQAGCRGVSLQLGRGNDAARAFYHQRGYRERTGFELLEKPLPPSSPG
jgi:GNAT superfamily N-acetyltransferase